MIWYRKSCGGAVWIVNATVNHASALYGISVTYVFVCLFVLFVFVFFCFLFFFIYHVFVRDSISRRTRKLNIVLLVRLIFFYLFIYFF